MSLTRTLRRVDVLILLVAMAAIVMRNDREVSEVFTRDWAEAVARRWPLPYRSIVAPILRLKSDLMAALTVMTVGLGLAILRRPRVPAGKKWPGRGASAIAVGGLAVVYGIIPIALEAIADPTSRYFGLSNPHFLSDSLRSCQGGPGNSILGAWSLLALAGRWRSKEEGLGRLGCLLGWCWLASIAFDLSQSTIY